MLSALLERDDTVVDIADYYGMTPLHFAINMNDVKTFRALVMKGGINYLTVPDLVNGVTLERILNRRENAAFKRIIDEVKAEKLNIKEKESAEKNMIALNSIKAMLQPPETRSVGFNKIIDYVKSSDFKNKKLDPIRNNLLRAIVGRLGKTQQIKFFQNS